MPRPRARVSGSSLSRREVMNFGRGQYAGLLLTDTEFGADHNRVAGGDVAFKRGRALSGERILSLVALADR